MSKILILNHELHVFGLLGKNNKYIKFSIYKFIYLNMDFIFIFLITRVKQFSMTGQLQIPFITHFNLL